MEEEACNLGWAPSVQLFILPVFVPMETCSGRVLENPLSGGSEPKPDSEGFCRTEPTGAGPIRPCSCSSA